MKTRIDIVSGYHGAGKSALISGMLRTIPTLGVVVVLHSNPYDSEATLADMLVQLILKRQPARVLLDATGETPLEDLPRLVGKGCLKHLAYCGTLAFVMDGSAFLQHHTLLQEYYERQIKKTSVVFITHADGLDAGEKLTVLSRVWEINRHVHLMVEPLYGIDLWKVFDLPAACERHTIGK